MLLFTASAGVYGDDRVDFVRDIRPILADHCYACHGPSDRSGGLRLDARSATVRGGDGGRVIKPGDPAASPLIQRVTAEDRDVRMPLDRAALRPEQIAVLESWIEQGADWPDEAAGDEHYVETDHWAFEPPERPDPPALERFEDRVRNAIDRFILARLEAEGLEPAPEADRHTLVRRLYLDLIGLPPTPEQADAFVHDDRSDAYERLVDDLLASPHYGEHQARRWLDLARYADTHGYEKDRPRSIWPWRDWVIGAFNEDMPFDEFTVRQIAGDMLDGATLEDRIATGFHRNTMINEEGGIDVEEFRYEAVVDRVNTTGTVWLGLTVSCAQCHTHKYDPITQREYFELLAFMDNADEPEVAVPDPAIAERRAEIEGEIGGIEAGLLGRADEVSEAFTEWRAALAGRAADWRVQRPVSVGSANRATLSVLDDGSVLASGDIPNTDTYTIEIETDLSGITAMRLEALPHESLPRGGPGRAPLFSEGDFMLADVTVAASPAGEGRDAQPITLGDATESYTQDGRSAAAATDGKIDTGWSIKGRVGEAHHAVFEFDEPAGDGEGPIKLTITLRQPYIHQMTLGRFRVSLTTDERPIVATDVPAQIEAIVAHGRDRSDDEARRQLVRHHALHHAEAFAEERERIAELRRSMPEHPTTMVMTERSPEHARETRMRARGEFLSPTEAVEPAVPAILHRMDEELPRNRLGLARWLIDEQNPLVGRVVVNRLWQAHFGRGIVGTPEDFGTRGERPTHPDLLDYLATEFIDRGWSMKKMHRLIVTSATYRQDSAVSAELLARDPDNRLLARGPRFRVPAETIRDIALTASGQIEHRVGGPSVFPPQPEGVTDASFGGFDWEESTGPDRYRRGLYTYIKRTAPYAAFTTFDATSRERCTARRERSNTPLQALTLLNDAVFVEAARALARRTLDEAPSATHERIAHLFRRALTRPPDDDEAEAIAAFYESQAERIAAGELDPAAIVGLEDEETAAPDDLTDWAAWTAVARAVLNLDETITKE